MAGVAEKARYYLERAVPQLREWEEKEIFSKDEIRNIVSKRNTFEHRVLSPGNKPSDWAAYAQWEQSLESLRSKRCKRLKIRHLNSAHQGQGRVLATYERAVNRHPGSAALWREYLGYTHTVKATNRFRITMTKALRMLPTDPELWIMAGKRSAQNGDMGTARAFFMRGCRFCNKDGRLWIEYARSEMEWLEKMEKKKGSKMGSDPLRSEKQQDDDYLQIAAGSDEDDEDEDTGMVLPEPPKTQENVIDRKVAKELASNPALDGAIPMAIFDISRKQPFFDANIGATFFDLVTSFRSLELQPRISQHIMQALEGVYLRHPATADCRVRESIIGISATNAEFPRNLRTVLACLKEELETTEDREDLVRRTHIWIDGYLAAEDLDEGIRIVLEHTKKNLAKQ